MPQTKLITLIKEIQSDIKGLEHFSSDIEITANRKDLIKKLIYEEHKIPNLSDFSLQGLKEIYQVMSLRDFNEEDFKHPQTSVEDMYSEELILQINDLLYNSQKKRGEFKGSFTKDSLDQLTQSVIYIICHSKTKQIDTIKSNIDESLKSLKEMRACCKETKKDIKKRYNEERKPLYLGGDLTFFNVYSNLLKDHHFDINTISILNKISYISFNLEKGFRDGLDVLRDSSDIDTDQLLNKKIRIFNKTGFDIISDNIRELYSLGSGNKTHFIEALDFLIQNASIKQNLDKIYDIKDKIEPKNKIEPNKDDDQVSLLGEDMPSLNVKLINPRPSKAFERNNDPLIDVLLR